MTTTTKLDPTLAKPEGLSAAGERAYSAIIALLEAKGTTYTGGCTAFASPAKWRERGEEYGLKSVLVIVHDGGDLAPYFNLDRCEYPKHEAMQQALAKVGLYAEQCTGWYSAIYRSDGVVEELPPEKPLTAEEDAKVVAYRDADLLRFGQAILDATTLWRTRCSEYLAAHGDGGSCVLGAGITVDYLAPRCRRVKPRMIISANQVTGAQGSLVWEASVKEVLAFLKERGVEAEYECGRMD